MLSNRILDGVVAEPRLSGLLLDNGVVDDDRDNVFDLYTPTLHERMTTAIEEKEVYLVDVNEYERNNSDDRPRTIDVPSFATWLTINDEIARCIVKLPPLRLGGR
jgi:hypothetical protein